PAHGSVIGSRRFFGSRLARNRGDRYLWRGNACRNRGKSIHLACPEQIVAAGDAEIARSLLQNRAYIVRLQRRIAFQYQRRNTADIGSGKRGARRDRYLSSGAGRKISAPGAAMEM